MGPWILALALARVALAQTPGGGPFDEVDTIGPDGVYEVRVYGDGAVEEARRAIVSDMEALGWDLVDERDGDLVFRAPRGWMGTAVVHREGFIGFDAPAMLLQGGSPEAMRAARGPSAQRSLALQTLRQERFPGLDTPADAARRGALELAPLSVTAGTGASRAKLQGPRDTVAIGIEPALRRYREVVQETAFADRLADLERRLWALWELGIPLEEGSGHLPGLDERRAAVLAYWASRDDSEHGRRACEVVERWLEEAVLPSDAPVTVEEARAAEQIAAHGRTLPTR